MLEQVQAETSGDKVKLGNIIEALQGRGFGPVLLVPALIALLPTGGIPGVPSTCGILIFLVATQMVVGQKNPWMPSILKNVDFSRDKLNSAIDKAKPFTRKIDRWFNPRLQFLIQDPMNRVIALLCAVIGLSMIPLEIIPFAAAIPSLSIIFAAIGLTTKDGLVALIALIAFTGSAYLCITTFLL